MFSQETVVIEVSREQLDSCSSRDFAELLKRLAYKPKESRAKRSAFMLSFEAAGVSNMIQDAKARRYISNLVKAVPFVGYFINGDPPFFYLRKFSLALSYSETNEFTSSDFVKAHNQLYKDAVEFCPSVGDREEILEEVFVVNLIPEVLSQDSIFQARAMRALYTACMISLSSSPKLRKLAFSEAERIWGHSQEEFSSPQVFLHEFERTFQTVLKGIDVVGTGITKLIEDVGPLATISAFGFYDSDSQRVEKKIQWAREKVCSGWAFTDMRGLGSNDARLALLKVWNADVLVLVLRPTELVLPISLFIRGVVDSRECIDLGDGKLLPRRSGQSVVVVCEGLKELRSVPLDLERISYWLFEEQLNS